MNDCNIYEIIDKIIENKYVPRLDEIKSLVDKFGNDLLEQLVEIAFIHPGTICRKDIIRVLGQVSDLENSGKAFNTLHYIALEDYDENIRFLARDIISKIRSVKSIEIFSKALDYDEIKIQIQAVLCLRDMARQGNNQAIQILIQQGIEDSKKADIVHNVANNALESLKLIGEKITDDDSGSERLRKEIDKQVWLIEYQGDFLQYNDPQGLFLLVYTTLEKAKKGLLKAGLPGNIELHIWTQDIYEDGNIKFKVNYEV